jgi:hypothetical protein
MSRFSQSTLQGTISPRKPACNPNWRLIQVSWPTSDILTLHKNDVYQQILTFLLQLQRTKYLLDRVGAIAQQRDRRGLKGHSSIVHVVRLQLTWFVNTLLHHLGIMVPFLLSPSNVDDESNFQGD